MATVRPKDALTPFMVVLAGTVAVVANAVWHSGGNTGDLGRALGDLPAALGFGAIIWGIAQKPGRLLSSPPLRVLGTLSFGIYLWHMPVMFALQVHDRFPERFVPAIEWVLPLTFLLATASWWLIEKPAIAFSGRALRARRPPAREAVPAES
jgi:peptidoglycan/LPS O-acetylase OafA/YrhL